MDPQWIMAIVALIGVPIALYQYRKVQGWKRSEWVAQEVKEFLADPAVINALRMLDCENRTLPLLHPMAKPGDVFSYDQGMLLHALSSASSPQKRDFTKEEVSIRDCFDSLLDRLERFQRFVDAKLVTFGDLKPYLQYWLEIIGDEKDPAKAPAVRARLWAFIRDYGYDGTQRLLASLGYDIARPATTGNRPAMTDSPEVGDCGGREDVPERSRPVPAPTGCQGRAASTRNCR